MNDGKNIAGLPMLPTDYLGPCRFALDDLGWNAGIVTGYNEGYGQFAVQAIVESRTYWVDRAYVLRPGEEMKYAVLRRGKLDVKCEIKYEEYDSKAGKRAAVVLEVTANGTDCGKVTVASGPALDVADLFAGEIDLGELNRRWRGIH